MGARLHYFDTTKMQVETSIYLRDSRQKLGQIRQMHGDFRQKLGGFRKKEEILLGK